MARSDSAQNNENLVQAARQAFTGGTRPPTIESVARRAGVARSTAYRHFPDRQAMAAAVARGNLGELRRAAAAGAPLRELLREILVEFLDMPVLLSVSQTLPVSHQNRLRREMAQALRPAFESAAARGQLRPGFTPELFIGIATVLTAGLAAQPPGPEGPLEAAVLIDVVLDGICPAGP